MTAGAKKNLKQGGYGLLEILIVLGVGIMVFLSVEQYLNFSLKAASQDNVQTAALYLAKASIEEARGVRDGAWSDISALTPGNNYYFQSNGATPAKWVAAAGTKTSGLYTVWVNFSAVQRDANSNIVASGGTVDNNTLKIISYVTWAASGATKQISLSEYLTNFK